jgi:hypothetical protein
MFCAWRSGESWINDQIANRPWPIANIGDWLLTVGNWLLFWQSAIDHRPLAVVLAVDSRRLVVVSAIGD